MPNQPLFSKTARDELLDDYDETTATRIAATEMDGAYEDPKGRLDARQTQCDKLEYNEDLPESEGQQAGQKKCEEELNDFLEEGGYTDVNDWIAKNSK